MTDEAKVMPDFRSEPERQAWITEHADYFTVTAFTGPTCKPRKIEVPSLEGADALAFLISALLQRPAMVYAVYGPYDTYVKTVDCSKKEGKNEN